MKQFQKILCPLLAVVLMVSILAVPVSAATGARYSVDNVSEHNAAVSALRSELQDKYGITITYPTYDQGGEKVAGIYPETLQTLDTALGYVTPKLVKDVSRHYLEKTGSRLKISYKFRNLESNELTAGGFDDKKGLIEYYIPSPGTGAYLSGDNPMTIVHEFGHALYFMIEDTQGTGLKNQWTSYNGSYTYKESNIRSNPSETTFVSGYAATTFYEDFAETFAHGFVCNRSGMGLKSRLTSGGGTTALGKKIALVESALTTYFPEATSAHSNFKLSQTVGTGLKYNGMTLSGSHLQYIGFPEPRHFPLSIINQYPEITQNKYKWVSDIGGWTATANDGSSVIVFPDGTHGFR